MISAEHKKQVSKQAQSSFCVGVCATALLVRVCVQQPLLVGSSQSIGILGPAHVTKEEEEAKEEEDVYQRLHMGRVTWVMPLNKSDGDRKITCFVFKFGQRDS